MTSALAIVSLCLTFFIGAYARVTEKIIGGTTASISEVPYIVSLRRSGIHFCGGAIISHKHILTAAHCLLAYDVTPPYNNIDVVSGSSLSSGSGGKFHRVIYAEANPGFNGLTEFGQHDLAVLTLMDNIIFNSNQRKIDLPTSDVDIGVRATMAGWGSLVYPSNAASPVLKKMKTSLKSISACQELLPHGTVYSSQICALEKEGTGICLRDSGGPLTVNNQIIGIASWIFPCALGYPDVYTKVYSYRQWIINAMARH